MITRLPHLVALSVLASASLASGQTFTNATAIGIPDVAPATVYPSTIAVPALAGPIAGLTVSINSFYHSFPQDCIFVLVAPNGNKYALSNRCGDGFSVSGITVRFSGDATTTAPAPLISGTFLPSNCFNSQLPAPGPGTPYSADFSNLYGTVATGNWSLYVADLAGSDVGQIAGGWSISFDAQAPSDPSSGSAFTYQGQLKNADVPVTGSSVHRYRLLDALTGGTQIGPSVLRTESVTNGLFSTVLDFGPNAFENAATRWLEITVNGTVLTPRSAITAAPHALDSVYSTYADHATTASTADTANNTRGISVDGENHVGIGGPAVAEALFLVQRTETEGVDQQNTAVPTFGTNVGDLAWQSFTAGVNGRLIAIDSSVGNAMGATNTFTLTIYTGQGTGGAVLSQTQFTLTPYENTGSATSYKTYTLGTTPTLTAGQVYTFALSASNGVFVGYTGNEYAGGISSHDPGIDQRFRTIMSTAASGAAALAVTPTGRVGINTTAPTQALHVIGNILANNVAVPSSIRFKDRVYDMDDALENLLKLKGVRFDWKPQYAATRGFTHDLGFVAEDVEKVFPEVVMHDDKGNVTGMDYSRLTAVTVQAIKQQQRTIESLKADAKLRDAQNADLKARLEAIEKMLKDGK